MFQSHRSRLIAVFTSAAAIAALSSACKKEADTMQSATPAPAAQPATVTEVVLGQPAAFTGPSAALGIEMWRGASAAFSQHNDRPMKRRFKVTLVTADDGYEADRAAAAVRKLVDEHKVFAIFGGVGTPTIVKALPVVEEYYKKDKLFYFANFTGAQPQREPPYAEFVFNVRASYRDETKALVDFLVQAGRKKIGIFIQDDAYGESGREGVLAALKANKLELAGEARYPRGQLYPVSTDAQVKKLKDAGAEAVIAVGAYQACAAFVRDVRKTGSTMPIANLSFVGSEALLDLLLAEQKTSGKPMIVNLLNSQVVFSPHDKTNHMVDEYQTAIDRYKPTKPEGAEPSYVPKHTYSFGSLEGYVSARAFTAVLDALQGELTREAFIKTAETMGPMDLGMRAEAQFTPTDHQLLDTVWLTYASESGWLPAAQNSLQK